MNQTAREGTVLSIGRLRAAGIVLVIALAYSILSLSEYGALAAIGIVLSMAGIVALFYARRRLDARLTAEREKAFKARVPQLIEQVENWRQPVIVKGSVWFPVFVGVMFTALGTGLWVGIQQPDVKAILAGLFFLVLGLVPLIAFLPRLAKPALSVAAEGIALAGYGMLGWDEIDGIDLIEVRSKGWLIGHRLELLVPNLQQRRSKMAPSTRLVHALTMWGRARNVVVIFLRKSSEAPEAIELLCKELWAKATGRTHLWSRLVPDQLNDAHKKLSVQRAKLDKAIERDDPDGVQRVLEEMADDLRKLNKRA